jgi:type IV pilus biogenesis protein CpaD/CtpE
MWCHGAKVWDNHGCKVQDNLGMQIMDSGGLAHPNGVEGDFAHINILIRITK